MNVSRARWRNNATTVRSRERVLLGACGAVAVIRIAALLRILPDFSAFCRRNPLIPLIRRALRRTLDLRIGVRIPASQPLLHESVTARFGHRGFTATS